MRRWLLICGAVLVGVGCGALIQGSWGAAGANGAAPAMPSTQEVLRLIHRGRPGLRVLFIGNSFTSPNSMVGMVTRLGEPTGRILAAAYDPPGSTFQDANSDPALARLLGAARWDVVVLQEQSQLPELPYWLTRETVPALASLSWMIRRDGAVPLLFETWGYQHGDLVNTPDDSYQAMQRRLHAGYAYMARSQHIQVAPVGDAWANALAQRPSLPLWAEDGHHPSIEGSYLTAAVLAATLNAYRSPHGPTTASARSKYTAGLDPATAAWLRHVAITAVANHQIANRRPH